MGVIYAEDSTNAWGLQSGLPLYAGYWDGPFANLSSIRSRFPNDRVMGYATRSWSMQGADAIDCEPGTIAQDFTTNADAAVQFVRSWKGGSGIFGKPVVYMMASWQAAMENHLANAGISRSQYYLNSSHATGYPHFCAPGGCGYGRTQADMTQFQFAQSWDKTVIQDYTLKGAAQPGQPVPPPVSYHEGMRGAAIVSIRVLLDAFGAQLPRLADGYLDAFGPTVYAAVIAFQTVNNLTPDGIVGPVTWTALHNRSSKSIVHPIPQPGPVPVPPPGQFTFSAPRNLVVRGGHTGFVANWQAPENAGGHPELTYQLYVYKGIAKRTNLIGSYPRHPGNVLTYAGGHLAKGFDYTVHVVAGEGHEARPWTYASATFHTK